MPLFFILGLIAFIYQGKKKADMNARLIFSGLFGLTLLIMGFYLQLNWDRYYVPLAPFILFFQGYGIATILQLGRLIDSKKLTKIFQT